ncbi:beta-galactosidase-1-like protein 2 [Scleropages formosus]|uniref:beta-galactosidase-1-like protein 2 n=1 Tax=Scleropages formosus TaxID=113540 RepID=UPI0010FAC392|nr:beta-galactosidase-1-like protein 2 [Scleropages formosus]
MVVLRLRHLRRRDHVLLCFTIIGILIYHFMGNPRGTQTVNRRQGLRANSSQFTLGGEGFRILAGSIHYFRVPRAYWKDRMLKLRACGFNTLTTYVPWNLHEPQRGMFVFERELDLEAYISMAASLDLWVILQPGPYISADWDLGGLPSWLLRDEDMKLRSTYPGFIEAVNSFFDQLIPKVLPLQFKRGGPIIAVQVEDEYGSYGQDGNYMDFIKEALLSRGINELLLTSDRYEWIQHGGVTGALRTIKLHKPAPEIIQYLDSAPPNDPQMMMHFLSGWFDFWGSLHHVLAAEDMVGMLRKILRRGMSINIYMFHGGTNFGFMNGGVGAPSYKSQITSYDYDAPVSEGGDYTPKYLLLRDLLSQYHREELPEMPVLQGKAAYEAAVMYQHLSLWEGLRYAEGPFKSVTPIPMENLPLSNGNGQSYGYTLYETVIGNGGVLNSQDNIRDQALVFVDKRFIGRLTYKNRELAVPDGKGQRTLSVLVENCGRVASGESLNEQRKGLIGDILLNNTPLRNFEIYSLDMNPKFMDSLRWAPWELPPYTPSFPAFFLGRLFVDGYPSDTFVKLPGWGKGVVFVNGQNLGRYWSVGPQQALYLPGPWLNSGMNEVIIFEEQEADLKIQFESSPDLGMTADIW